MASAVGTLGTLVFCVRYEDVLDRVIERQVCVLPSQQNQSDTFVHDAALREVTCAVTSNWPGDCGVAASVFLQSLVQGLDESRAPLPADLEQRRHQRRKECRGACPCQVLLPVSNVQLSSTSISLATGFISLTGTGNNVLALGRENCQNCPAINQIPRATVQQGLAQLTVPIQASSCTTFTVSFSTANFTAGPATITFQTLAGGPITIPVQMVDM